MNDVPIRDKHLGFTTNSGVPCIVGVGDYDNPSWGSSCPRGAPVYHLRSHQAQGDRGQPTCTVEKKQRAHECFLGHGPL